MKILRVKILDKDKKLVRRAFPSEIGPLGYVEIMVGQNWNAEEWAVLTGKCFKPTLHLIPYDMNILGQYERIQEPSKFTFHVLYTKNATRHVTSSKWGVYMFAPGKG